MTAHRRTLLEGLSGRVVEVGAGNGLNFAHYPPAVTRVIAIEPERTLRELAVRAAAKAPVPVEVLDGVAEALPVADESVDAVVVSLVLCSFSDPDAALREARRVLVPGGRLCFLEHVRADTPGMVRFQRLLDATVWPRLAGGCHTARDSAAAIERAGFAVERMRRFHFAGIRGPATYFILGAARRP